MGTSSGWAWAWAGGGQAPPGWTGTPSCFPPLLPASPLQRALQPGGATIYSGTLGDSSERLIQYLQGIQGVPPCPERHNPANWSAGAGVVAAGQALAWRVLQAAQAHPTLAPLHTPALRLCTLRLPLPGRMLEVASPASEAALGIDFAAAYAQSPLAK